MTDAPRFTLHGNHHSGNAAKVALMLELCGAPYTYRHVAIFDGASRTAEYKRDVNRFGEVPVLQDGARTIVQSAAILWHLAKELGQYGAQSYDDELHILEWLAWENHRLLPGVARLRMLRKFGARLPAPPAPALVEAVEGWAVQAIEVLEAELATRRFLVGGRATIADIAACPYLFMLDEAGLDGARWPHVQAWLARIAALPRFKDTRTLLPLA